MSTIYNDLKNMIKTAMRDKNSHMLTVLRSLDAAIQLKAKESKIEITDDLVYEVTKKSIKVVLEEIDNAKKYGRTETAFEKNNELTILKVFQPKELSKEETEKAVDDTIKIVNATTIKDMGKVMGALKGKFGATINMGIASNIVKEKLNN